MQFKIPKFIHRFSSPKIYYHQSQTINKWLWVIFFIFTIPGIYLGLFNSPEDYQQGNSVRIMYVHVPASWMSMFLYVFIALNSIIFLVWRIKLSDIMAQAAAPIGAVMTALALITGSIWGKPMWGTWWTWDARLTSELILLFLYLGYIALRAALEDSNSGGKAAAVLAIVGVVNIPIIHFSVEWWNTLHQGATVTKLDTPSIDVKMLIPLLLMTLSFQVYSFIVIIDKARCILIYRERNSRWVKDLYKDNN